MGDQDRCVEVVIDRFFTLGDQFIHIYRITGRSFHFVQCPDRCHQAFISLLGGFQGLVREIQRTPVVGLQDKETDGHRGIGLLEHIVFSRKELVQGDEIPQRFAHFLSLDSDHIVVHPIFHGFVSVGSRTLGNLTFVVGKLQVQPAAMDIETVAQILLAHARTFQVPTRKTVTPRRRPAHDMFRSSFFP